MQKKNGARWSKTEQGRKVGKHGKAAAHARAAGGLIGTSPAKH
jgi:hypothetical protein